MTAIPAGQDVTGTRQLAAWRERVMPPVEQLAGDLGLMAETPLAEIGALHWRLFRLARIVADTGLRPPFALEAFSDVDADVRQSIARIKASPYIPHKDSVRGFVYEVETGRLREVKD